MGLTREGGLRAAISDNVSIKPSNGPRFAGIKRKTLSDLGVFTSNLRHLHPCVYNEFRKVENLQKVTTSSHVKKREVTEMKMCGHTLRDHARKDNITERLRVESITERYRKARLGVVWIRRDETIIYFGK